MKLSVTELESMDRATLTEVWSGLFCHPVPKGLSSPFMRRFIAFELQSRASGGLPGRFASSLNKAAGRGTSTATPALKPGGRLLREWNGTTHVVDVVEAGFLWNGQRHASLSAIARAITGARWSGPRFFGLNRTPGK